MNWHRLPHMLLQHVMPRQQWKQRRSVAVAGYWKSASSTPFYSSLTPFFLASINWLETEKVWEKVFSRIFRYLHKTMHLRESCFVTMSNFTQNDAKIWRQRERLYLQTKFLRSINVAIPKNKFFAVRKCRHWIFQKSAGSYGSVEGTQIVLNDV